MGDDEDGSRGLGRRGALLVGASALGGAAVTAGGFGIGAAVETAAPAPASAAPKPPPLRRFRSSMVTLPAMTVKRFAAGSPEPGYLLASPVTDVATAVIVDDDAEPVWVDPEGRYVMDLDVQVWRGERVLTFWAGKFIDGHGVGACHVLDRAYRPVATVQMGAGMTADMHEFRLTDRGTALVIAYPRIPVDLSPVGGPRRGWALGGRVQEVDVATGEVLLDWEALDHVRLGETFQPITRRGAGSGRDADTAFDPVHVNAVEADGDALLVSARHTHTIYRIDRRTGEVRWRMGGRRSDLVVERPARFAWQHDCRRLPDGTISLFDNHRKQPPGRSAGLILEVDEVTRSVTLRRRYASAGHFGYAEGSSQVLPGGNVLVGWGKDTSATEYAAAGEPVFELRDLGVDNYRVRRRAWVGRPATPPDVTVESAGGSARVFASWNGATEVRSWRVETGASEDGLHEAAVVPRTGFETKAVVEAGPFLRVTALDAAGRALGRSRVVRP